MARLLLSIVVGVALNTASGSPWAADWAKLGTCGFTTTPSWMQDYKRIRFNSIAFDGSGNIYATACNGNNNGMSGGLTIFQPNGTKLADVDLNALGYPGAITKLVTGGDGVVYALQNWLEINWSFAQNVNRILAILPNGSVVEVWNAGPQSDANRITGMTVGADGNIYWTMNGADNYWKYHFFWRYDVASGIVEDLYPAGNNLGWSETSRMFNLDFVGASPDTFDFAVIQSGGGSTWAVSKLSATAGRQTVATGACNPQWGRDWITATAWDPVNDILWVGGRGTGSGPWTWNGGAGASATISNGEMTVVKGSSTTGASAYYELAGSLSEASNFYSIASRFKLNSYSGGYNGTMLQIAAPGNEPWGKIVVSGSDYVLRDSTGILATLGPINIGEYNTVYVVIDCANDKIECWWNGFKKYDGPASLETYYSWARAHFGAAVRDGSYAGAATVVFDWVATDAKRMVPGDPMPTALGYYLDCTLYPDLYATTNIMSCWPGSPDPGFFDPAWCHVWHTNGNDPYASGRANGGRYWVQAIACNPADGEAWMAWNGEAGYSYDPIGAVWSRRYVNGTISALGFEGIPEPGAQVVALGFNGGKAYAVTCNMTTGVYNVYYKVPGPEIVSIGQAKQCPAGTLIKTDAAKLVTYPGAEGYSEYFYIEEDDRSSGIKVIPDGLLETPRVGQKAVVEGRVGVQNGEAVIFASSVITSSAETGIQPVFMSVNNVGGTRNGIQPPTLSGGSAQYGFPQTLNTTGLLIRVAGTLRKPGGPGEFLVDDGSPFPLRIEYPDVPGNDGDPIAVTGVSGVAWDGANGFRIIMPRDSSDIQMGF